MEETQEDYSSFYKVLKSNIEYKHPGNKLPSLPWFLKSCKSENVMNILKKLLEESKYKTSDFLDRATFSLLKYRSQKDSQTATLAALISENIDIREKLELTKDDGSKTKGRVKLLEAFSSIGNVSITLQLGDEVKNLEVGEWIEGEIDLKSNTEITIYEENSGKVGEILLYFGVALDDIYYLSLVDRKSFTTNIEEIKEKYRVKIEVTLFLSNKDKREILIQHLYENENREKKEKENEDLYDNLLKIFGISVEGNEITSTLVTKHERSYCGSCQVL